MADEPVVEKPVVEEPVVEAAPEPVVEKSSTAAEIASAVAAAIKTPVDPNARAREEYSARINAEAQRTGKTVEEVVADDNARREANLRDNLPMFERLGAADAKEELGDRADLIEEVKGYMAQFPANVRANPQAWKDAAALTLGKHYKDKRPEPIEKKSEDKTKETGKVMGGGVKTGLTERGGGGSGKPAAKKEYSELERRIIDTTCGGDAEAYEKFKSKDSTKPRAETPVGQNKADMAWKQLTKGAKV